MPEPETGGSTGGGGGLTEGLRVRTFLELHGLQLSSVSYLQEVVRHAHICIYVGQMYVCVCMCVCVCVCVYIYIYIYTHVYMYIYIEREREE